MVPKLCGHFGIRLSPPDHFKQAETFTNRISFGFLELGALMDPTRPCSSGAGPMTMRRPMSTRKFSVAEQGKFTPSHQHNLYSPPFPEIATLPNDAWRLLSILTVVALRVGNPSTKDEVPHVSSTNTWLPAARK